eukprot:TRINITY_DN7119_c0_g2_i2.p1 TRINITY_DN7119_c0_g2~~TRINITY_DN7119_c0_g2_i2.p1  ORF type:complete len:296 (-),score=16.95 TRINITY_DN7119_c0_g2_i2:299-1156(-)
MYTLTTFKLPQTAWSQRHGAPHSVYLRHSGHIFFNQLDGTDGTTQLPNNVVWLDPRKCTHDLLYGGNFVIQRDRVGGPGLVPYHKPYCPAPLKRNQFNRGSDQHQVTDVVVRPKVFTTPPTVFGEVDLQIAQFEVIEEAEQEIEQKKAKKDTDAKDEIPIDRITTGMILHPLYSSQPLGAQNEVQQHDNVYETETQSPRRTSKVRFTCNICKAINIKPVNPAAFKTGTIFAQCGKCGITHKLIDNLNIVHEVSGLVYQPPPNFFKNRSFSDRGPFPGQGNYFDIL